MQALLDVVKSSVIDNIPEERYSSKSETIVINKNNFNTKKYSVDIQAEDFYNLMISIFKSIYTDNTMPTIKELVFTTDKMDKVHLNADTYESDLKKEIIGSDSEKRVLFTYSIYLLKNKDILKHELSFKTGAEKKDSSIKLTLAKLSETEKQKDYEFVLQKDNKNILEVLIQKGSETSKVSATLEESKISITGDIKKDGSTRTMELNALDFDKKPVGTITTSFKEVKAKEEYNLTIDVNMSVDSKSIVVSMKNNI